LGPKQLSKGKSAAENEEGWNGEDFNGKDQGYSDEDVAEGGENWSVAGEEGQGARDAAVEGEAVERGMPAKRRRGRPPKVAGAATTQF
jgi:hypothetical protein